MSSKYPDAIPVENLRSKTIVDVLLQIFSRMGFPKVLQTDQGTSFMSALTTEFLRGFGIKVVRSSVYHPQSNPVERMHRTLKRILRVLCLESGPDWEKILPQALFALRTATHGSTGFSPAELVHGRNLRTPLMLLYEQLTEETQEEDSVVSYVFELMNRMKRCQELAVHNMQEAKEKQKICIFSNQPRCTDLAEHDIELESESPIIARPYRMTPRQSDILKAEVNKMLEMKVIEPGDSDFTSPMILVEAPGKDPRPCIDYRRLNKCDASNLGIGIVLSQVNEEGDEHPIMYLSTKFSPAEQKYSTTERECAAIVYAVQNYDVI
ncbi:hypothetical protein JTE90_023498 [Oedothorax gibbosus]|uniref:Integrase catalytic domain-containing protein n=1 Tax=Oedothorax gibbosus TaxID=931172 RepID=A0AAV6VPI9_9ARAC|nr:hypothetical protein JTE90_023498 [Oedothorax gibbosus]